MAAGILGHFSAEQKSRQNSGGGLREPWWLLCHLPDLTAHTTSCCDWGGGAPQSVGIGDDKGPATQADFDLRPEFWHSLGQLTLSCISHTLQVFWPARSCHGRQGWGLLPLQLKI